MDVMHWKPITTWHADRFAIVSGALILIWLGVSVASALAWRSLAGGNGEGHIILHALGVALFLATLWSALQFEGTPLE